MVCFIILCYLRSWALGLWCHLQVAGLVLFTCARLYMSFLLFCLFITIFIFILNYVLIVTFWISIYYKIWILLNIYCFIWNYWIIFSWHVCKCFGMLWVKSYQLVPREPCMSEQALLPIGCVIKSTYQGICSCSPIVNFLKFAFYHGMVTSVIFLRKI